MSSMVPAATTTVKKIDWETPTNKQGLDKMGALMVDSIEKALPRAMRGCGERMIRALIATCQQNDRLMKCKPITLFAACMQASRLGLEIGGPLGHAHLIPFKDTATLIIGYKGYAELAFRSGKVHAIQPGIVHERDYFDYARGTDSFLKHREFRGDRGRVLLYYVTVKTAWSSTFDLMTIEDAVAFRDRYATTKSAPQHVQDKAPWYDIQNVEGVWMPGNGFNWMAWKTIFRRMVKFMPISSEIAQAIEIEERTESGMPQQVDFEVPLLTSGDGEEEPQTQANQLRQRLDKTKGDGKLFDNAPAQKLPD